MSAASEQFFRTLAENSADILCRVGPNRILRYASPSCTRILGWLPEEMIGTGPEAFVLPQDMPALDMAARQAFGSDSEGPLTPTTIRMRRKDGSFAWMEITARVVPSDDGSGRPAEVVLVMRDISDRKALEEQLSELAVTDGLTGLLNRRGFDDVLDEDWRHTLSAGSQLSLLMLDVDHFKAFNDRYGHQVGDDCLRAVAEALRSSLRRASDKAARYGGEELAVILPGTDAEGATEMAEAIRIAIKNLGLPHAGNPEHGCVTASIGVATALSRHGGSMRMPESLLLTADNALYRAKHSGRNRVASMLLVASKAS
jgi:diguanylate cyclase (GGDEF)-like protein/PAS domain S-box-containing protein